MNRHVFLVAPSRRKPDVPVTITQQEIADNLKLSRMTVRRYMEHLIALNEVVMHIEYDSVGRPSHSYRKMV